MGNYRGLTCYPGCQHATQEEADAHGGPLELEKRVSITNWNNFTCNHCGLKVIEPAQAREGVEVCAPCAEKEKARIQVIWDKIERLDGVTVIPNDLIMVWEFHKAPPQLQELSLDGGDEDWLVWVPKEVEFPYGTPSWIDRMSSCGDADMFLLPDGSRVFIAAH